MSPWLIPFLVSTGLVSGYILLSFVIFQETFDREDYKYIFKAYLALLVLLYCLFTFFAIIREYI